jgi:prevent-host-death family protein
MRNIPATKFKAQCLELMNRVAEHSESYVITKRGKPVAKLVPVKRKAKDSIFGWMQSLGAIQGDIVNPVILSEDWGSLGNWNELIEVRKASANPPFNAP